jgi:hypothetical protein
MFVQNNCHFDKKLTRYEYNVYWITGKVDVSRALYKNKLNFHDTFSKNQTISNSMKIHPKGEKISMRMENEQSIFRFL